MKTKIIIVFITLFFLQIEELYGQNTTAYNLSLYVLVADDKIPEEASRNLETKLQDLLVNSGLANGSYVDRFVLTAKADIVSKDILPTTPVRISQKIELTLMVGDAIENKLFTSRTVTLSGIGINESKAFVAAFSQMNSYRKEFMEMLQQSKNEITVYYTSKCPEIINRANTLFGMQKYDEAIHYLLSVPNICTDCFLQCQTLAETIYWEKTEQESASLFNQAKTEWMKHPDITGACSIAPLINRINPKSRSFTQIEKLRYEISDKLREDERKEWEFQMKKYEDDQAFKLNIVEACRAIGVAWGQGQPQSVTKTIVRSWWW